MNFDKSTCQVKSFYKSFKHNFPSLKILPPCLFDKPILWGKGYEITSRGVPYSVRVDDFRLINLRCQYYHNGIKKSYQFFGVNLNLKSNNWQTFCVKLWSNFQKRSQWWLHLRDCWSFQSKKPKELIIGKTNFLLLIVNLNRFFGIYYINLFSKIAIHTIYSTDKC